MADLSRRTFLGASAAAAGAAVIGVPIATAAANSGGPTAAPALADGGAALGAKASGPLVVYVPDAASGDVAIMVGTQEVTYHDPDLVARLARAASNG